MAEIGIKELKTKASQVIDEVSAGASYIVTKRGVMAAVIVPVEEAEDLVLANAEQFIQMRRKARAGHKRGASKRLEDID
ncbi:MAG: type II toxin-antitoxin system prevent-host-death family antitoxin [Actinomycetota bacterium]